MRKAGGRLRRSCIALGLAVSALALAVGPVRAADSAGTTTRRVAVVLINFRNHPAQPVTVADADAWTFTDARSVAALYREVSYQRLTLTGDTFGWFTLDRDDGPACDYAGWQAAAEARARQAGVPLDSYQHVVFAAPLIQSCDFRGGSAIGSSRSFVNGPTNQSQWVPLVAHELGHDLGAEHANGALCVDGTGASVALSTRCRTSYYADPFDLMGSGYRRQPNANHKVAMGLLPASAVQTIDASGEYRIGLLETEGPDPRLVRVPYDRDEDGAVRYLLLEVRQPSPFDEFAADDPGVRGVMVRLGIDGGLHGPTLLVDTTPETAGNFADAPLLPQRTLLDQHHRLAITVLDVGTAGAQVHIDYNGFLDDWATCDGVSVPARIGRGRTVPVEARFHNAGSTTWTRADGYDVRTAGAEGTVTLANADPVAPGATGVFQGTLTGPQQLGRQALTWRPRLGEQEFGDECSATVDVVADADPPSSPTSLRSSVQSQSSVQLSWNPSTDNVGVRGYRVWRSTDGTSFARIADVTGTSAPDSGLAVNTPYWYRVEAYDAGGNVSAPSGVLRVQIPDMTAPSAPPGLTVAGRGPGRIDLVWGASSDNVGVDRYRVYRRTGLSGAYTVVGESVGTSYRDGGLVTQVYSYYVTALDRAGNESARSNVVTDRPATCASATTCF